MVLGAFIVCKYSQEEVFKMKNEEVGGLLSLSLYNF